MVIADELRLDESVKGQAGSEGGSTGRSMIEGDGDQGGGHR